MKPSHKEMEQQDYYLRIRQEQFCLAATYVAKALSHIPEVQNVVLFGSVSGPLEKEVRRFRYYRRFVTKVAHERNDIDLAV
jgi:hypothetical protein